MDNRLEIEEIKSSLRKVMAYIPHYSQQENISHLKNRLKTITYRDSPSIIFEAYYSLYEKAHSFEKAGDLERALDYYYWILYVFYPIGTLYYERPAIICEKLKRYDEAILITKMYVKVSEDKNAHMDLPAAQHRLDRLLNKKKNQ